MTENTLYYGDNLVILRDYIADESVDLIYLDPPFNSQRTYNVLFRYESGEESEAQISAFTHLAIALQKYRLEEMFPGIQFKVIGEPKSLQSARHLAQQDRFQFEWWALSLVRARPIGAQPGSRQGKKGADRGIDGVITFIDEANARPKRVLVQVKSGRTGSRDIRDLVGTVKREKAAMGVFITLEEPTRDMITEAAAAGFYRSPGWNQNFPKIQILTVNELLKDAEVKMPPAHGTFKQAQRVRESGPEQKSLFD